MREDPDESDVPPRGAAYRHGMKSADSRRAPWTRLRMESITMRDEMTGNAPGETRGTEAAADAVEQRLVAFAEQLGRIVGTVQAKAEGWMDRDALNAQISTVRDSAAELLEHLGGKSATADKAATANGNTRSSAGRAGAGASTGRAKQPTREAQGSAGGAQSRGAATKAAASTSTRAKSATVKSATVKSPASTRNASQGRSGGVVDAPGKRHRKPAPNDAMPKGNDSRIARLKVANANATRGRGRG